MCREEGSERTMKRDRCLFSKKPSIYSLHTLSYQLSLPKPAASKSCRYMDLAILCLGTTCFQNCDSEISKSPTSKPDHINVKVTSLFF